MPDAPATFRQSQRTEVMKAEKPRARLLVVEDEALVAMLIEDILIEAGFEVIGPFGQAQQALTHLERGDAIDAAVLDVNLGAGERSFGVAKELTARGVPYVFVTGYGPAGLAGAYEGVPVLQKPFEPIALRRLLDEVLSAGDKKDKPE